MTRKRPPNPVEADFFEREFLRTLTSVKASLRSLQLKFEDGKAFKLSDKTRNKLQPEFDAVNVAFAVLNNPIRPEPEEPEEDIPEELDKNLDELLELLK